MKPALYVITGQTATGKTALGINLAKEKNGEIISADSRQLYQHLDIITGKDLFDHQFHLYKILPNGWQIGYYLLNQVPVWLYDIVSPKQSFSAYDWAMCAREVLTILQKKQKTPIVVGGSYFYIHSLLYGYSDFGVNPNPALRQELEQLSILELQQRLQKANPQVYQALNSSDQKNPRRLIRWLEKCLSKNKNQPLQGIGNKFNLNIIGLRFKNPEIIKEKIKERINKRMEQGALEEMELLLKMGFNRQNPGLKTIGYQQLMDFVDDKLALDQALDVWLHKEKQYAKRQITLMKKNPVINWQIL